MILKRQIKASEKFVQCINIIWDKGDPKFGQTCGRRLIHKNSGGEVAGEIKCIRCGALYDIINNYLILIKNGEK